NQLGYACDVFTIDAAHFVPQSRLRVFVVGVQMAEPHDDVLTLAQRPMSLTTKALDRAIAANRDLSWNFLNIPPLPEGIARSLDSLVEDLPEADKRWWPASEVERHLQMMSAINFARTTLQDVCGQREAAAADKCWSELMELTVLECG
ncbi:MAG: hypothetical protein WBA01_02300, partial [Phormidesmis sp.]